MNLSTRKLTFMLIGCSAAATIGVAALFGVISPSARPAPLATESAVTGRSPTASARPAAARRAASSPTAVPATATPQHPVTLALTSLDRQPSLGGVTVTIAIENHQSAPLNFSFDPSYDLKLVDSRGTQWPLRWAEYDGAPKVAANQSTRLARAFFAGPVATRAAWPLTVSAQHTPAGSKVEWHVGQHGTPTPIVDQTASQLPRIVPSGPITLNLENPQSNSALGGIQVDLMIHNARSSDLVFRFDPNAQLTADDNLHRPWSVRWAQYDGTVHVGPESTVRLARVFLAGPLSDGSATWLNVQLRQVPGAPALRNVVALQ